MSNDNLTEKKKATATNKKFVDGKEHDSKKYINLRPTMEQLIKTLGESILSNDTLVISENETINTADLIVDVINESFDDFFEDLPAELHEVADILFDHLYERIEEIECGSILTEAGVLDVATRRRKAALIRRYRTKIMTARKRATRRRADSKTMNRRSQRKARSVLRDRYTGKKKYHNMSPSEKLAVDKRMARVPASVLKRLSNKMMAQVRKTETDRLKAKAGGGKKKDEPATKKTKAATVKKAVVKAAERVGAGKVTQDKSAFKKKKSAITSSTRKTVKEDIALMEDNFNINSLFESEFKASDLPKKESPVA